MYNEEEAVAVHLSPDLSDEDLNPLMKALQEGDNEKAIKLLDNGSGGVREILLLF
jgi:hypothetical protein